MYEFLTRTISSARIIVLPTVERRVYGNKRHFESSVVVSTVEVKWCKTDPEFCQEVV